MYEINALMKYEYYAHKDTWEQSRLNAYMTAQVNSKRHLKQSDIVEFYWEKETEEKETNISKEDIARLQAKAEAYLQNNKTDKKPITENGN